MKYTSLSKTTKIYLLSCAVSSLRRLKHTGSNLLGGRAWRQLFLPSYYPELPKFDLLKIFNHGLLPEHYLSDSIPIRNLEGYVVDYII